MAKLGKHLSKSGKVSAEDRLLEYYYKATDYFENNKNRVYTILTVIVVIIAVIFIYFRNLSSNAETAALELAKTEPLYKNEMYLQAINGDSLGITKGLLYIAENYGSTESGETAKIMLANSYYFLGDFSSAEKYYKSFSGKSDLLRSASYAGLAAVYDAQKNFSEAAKYYEKAVNKYVPNSDEYLFSAVRSYFLANDTENMKKAAKTLKKDFPKSKFIQQLNRYITES